MALQILIELHGLQTPAVPIHACIFYNPIFYHPSWYRNSSTKAV